MCINVPNFVSIGQTVKPLLRYGHFYRATLCERGICCCRVSVHPSVCPPNFPCPRLDLQLMGAPQTTYVGINRPLQGQPTRPTQLFIFSRSINK